MTSAHGKIFTAGEAARECGVDRTTIARAAAAGRIPGAERDKTGAWTLPLSGLLAAGYNPGKPTPPDPAPVLEDRDHADTLARLRLELAEVRADARVATVERDAERRLREAAERERDVYRRMIEAPPVPAPSAPQTVEPSTSTFTSTSTSAPAPLAPREYNVGRFRRTWNVLTS